MSLIENTFFELLCEQIDENKDKPALVKGNNIVTYGQMLVKINKIASYLIQNGLKKNEKVVLWSGADPMWLCAYFGIIRAGGIAVILNANLSVKDAEPLVKFADTVFVMVGDTHDTKGETADIQILADAFKMPNDKIIGIYNTDFEAVSIEKDEVFEKVKLGNREDAYIIYTSGTTSFPKAVTSCQYALTNLGVRIVEAISKGKGDSAVMGVPLFHAYGIMVSWVYLSTGGTIYIPDRVKAEDVADVVVKYDVSDIWSVAVVYQGIIDSAEISAKVAAKVKFCTIAGSYTTPVQFMRFEAGLYNAKFINMYGMTETSAAYVMTRPEDSVKVRYNTLGKSVDGVEMRIWDKEKGFLPEGEVGEIVTRGFHIKNNYYKLPDDKQAIDEDGWLHSGDLGVLDSDGNLTIAGRIKDLIIKGGENLAPGEIESEILKTSDNIKNCRVFGYHDRVYGENIGACVVVDNQELFNEDDIKKTLKKTIGSYKTPAYFFVFDSFPLNANGKIDQNRLRNDMLTRKCKVDLEKMLINGFDLLDTSIVSSSYTYAPTAAWMEELSKALGFSNAKASKIRLAVEEMFYICHRNSSENNDRIILKVSCTDQFLRIAFSSDSLKYSFEHTEENSINELIVFKMVDDFHTIDTKDGRFYMQIDFAYEDYFDITEFLMHHEVIS